MLEPVKETVVSESIEDVYSFELALAELGLQFERLSLKKYPNGVHWHIRAPGQKGTLEATFDAEAKRLWLEVRKGREGIWQAEVIQLLKTSLSSL